VETGVPFQPTLFDGPPTALDPTFATLERLQLDDRSWVDHAPGWVSGSDALFEEVLRTRSWAERTRWMYDHRVREPRLTDPWSLESGRPLEPELLEDARRVLSARYGVVFDSAGFNLYRDGRDSVAWHADRIEKEIEDPVIALVSLGEPRRFLLRPKGGGPSSQRGATRLASARLAPPRSPRSLRGSLIRLPLRSTLTFWLGRGDLLVTGGATTRTWEHCVPKVARAGPRISVAYRHGLDPSAYGGRRVVAPGEDG
jgi:alkylated DNA repair dioxygenase AlkB